MKSIKGQITIVDLTDSRQLIAYIATTNRRQVIYDPTTNKYSPNYSDEPITLNPELYIAGGGSNIINNAKSVTWTVQTNSTGRFESIISDATYQIGDNNELIISRNVLEDTISMLYRLEVIYTDPQSGQDIIIQADMELVRLSNGGKGEKGESGEDVYVGVLTNENHTVYTDSNGNNGIYTGAETDLNIFKGVREDTENWEISVEEGIGIEGVFNEDTHTYTLTNIDVDSSRVIFTASKQGLPDIIKVFTINRLKAAKDGESAVTYTLDMDTVYLQKDRENNIITPSEILIKGIKSVGSEDPEMSPGYFVIYEQLEGTMTIDNYTDLVYRKLVDIEQEYVISDREFPYISSYRSTQPENEILFKPNNNVKKIHIEWYEDADYAILRDVEQIPVVSDGKDVYKVEINSINGDTFKNGIIDTWLYATVYKGDTDITSEIEERRFEWTRMSMDEEQDKLWNERYYGGRKEIKITHEDVYKRATFTCSIRKQ